MHYDEFIHSEKLPIACVTENSKMVTFVTFGINLVSPNDL